jgi:TIR domain
MNLHFNLIPVWDEATRDILIGKSVLISAPKHFGKNYYCSRLLKEKKLRKLYFNVNLDLTQEDSQKVNYKKIWLNFSIQLNLQEKHVTNKADFVDSILQLRCSKKILIIIKSNRRNKNLVVEIINTFQEISHKYPQEFYNKIVLLVLDDLTLYFHELSIKSEYSFWDTFETKARLFQISDSEPIKKIIQSYGYPKQIAEEYGKLILSVSGGHHGLVYLALSYLMQNGQIDGMYDAKNKCRQYLLTTAVIESIKKLLLNSKKEYFDEAFGFAHKKMSDNMPNQIIESLHLQGIILRIDAIFSELCPGLISELLKEVYIQKFAADLVPNKLYKEIFFSYAWGKRKTLIDKLYQELIDEPGLRPIMDKKDLLYRESITSFIKRIGKGDHIILAFSDKYLRSEYCMFELYELYRNSNLESKVLLKKVYPINIEKLNLNDPDKLMVYIQHWNDQLLKWEKLSNRFPEKYDQIKSIALALSELLSFLNDINSLNLKKLSNENFFEIKRAIRS